MEEKKKSVGFFGKLLGKNNDFDFSAEKAWIESTYGSGSYKNIETRIKDKQTNIKLSIVSASKQFFQDEKCTYPSYHCLISIEEDLQSSIDTIFEPFINEGFIFINLSDRIDEIDEPHVYLVTWKNAFKHKIGENNEKNQLLLD